MTAHSTRAKMVKLASLAKRFSRDSDKNKYKAEQKLADIDDFKG